jgi:hypothetical protein
MKPLCLLSMLAFALIAQPQNAAPGPWEQPAAALAEQIAGILGPSQAQLTIRNLSKISDDQIPAIRALLEQDLKTRGVVVSGVESANAIRVTLSENLRERLWVAEIVEGSETHVVMLHVDQQTAIASATPVQMALRKERILVSKSDDPILAAFEAGATLVALFPDKLVTFELNADGAREQNRFPLAGRHGLARDPRGLLMGSDRGAGFAAFLPGLQCNGTYSAPASPRVPSADGSLHCHDSDDPWAIAAPGSADGSPQLKAFFNAARNYFTGVVTPSLNLDLPPFYAAILVPRPGGAGLLIVGIDDKVQLVESGSLKPIAGTRDWGSDLASLNSGCGTGTQIVVSGSGESIGDSLRAYELPAQEAVPASAALAMDGTVTALWTADDGKRVFAVVRMHGIQGQEDSYEVDRVTANCN